MEKKNRLGNPYPILTTPKKQSTNITRNTLNHFIPRAIVLRFRCSRLGGVMSGSNPTLQGLYPLHILSHKRQVLYPIFSVLLRIFHLSVCAKSGVLVSRHFPRTSPSSVGNLGSNHPLVTLFQLAYFHKSRYHSVGSGTSADTRRYQGGP